MDFRWCLPLLLNGLVLLLSALLNDALAPLALHVAFPAVMAAVCARWRDFHGGVRLAFISGLMADAFAPQGFGVSVLLLCAAVCVLNASRRPFAGGSNTPLMIAVLLLNPVLLLVNAVLLGLPLLSDAAFWQRFSIELLVTEALMLPVAWFSLESATWVRAHFGKDVTA